MNRFSLLAALFVLPACNLSFLTGAECASDSDCHGTKICVAAACVECENDRDCDSSHVCQDNSCVRGSSVGEGEGEGGVGGEGEGEGGGAGEGEGEGGIGGEGEGEGEGAPGCGNVSVQGQCVGQTLEVCINNSLVTGDCSDTTQFAAGALCQEVNINYGFDCVSPAGAACLFQDPNDTTKTIQVTCQGSNAGCEITSDPTNPNRCVASTGLPSCSSAVFDGVCNGNAFVIGCAGIINTTETDGQPLYMPCGSFGGTCDVSTANKGCILPTTGAACLPGLSFCGTSAATAVACPTTRVCP